MTSRYLAQVFSPAVKAAQEANGSRKAYAGRDADPGAHDALSENEALFIASRDSFYMATAGAGGWPYLQHRGGKPGFIKVLDDHTLGLPDFRGNRQYVSVGNLVNDNRAAFFFMDYPRRARLKLLGRVRTVDLSTDSKLAAALVDAEYNAKVERGFIIDVEAFDWNCSQHITPRFTVAELAPTIDERKARITELEAEIARLRA